jgi:hypothetical protein
VSKIPTAVQNRVLERLDLEPLQGTINSVDYYHCVYELLYRLIKSSISPVPTLSPSQGATIMKRQLLATVLLSVLASSAFALPAAEQATPQNKAQAMQTSQTVARSGSQEDENRDYAKGAVAENGYNRLQEKGLVEGGAEQANKRAYTEGVAEGGADRLQELHQAQS